VHRCLELYQMSEGSFAEREELTIKMIGRLMRVSL
jgi:hypothetical protein